MAHRYALLISGSVLVGAQLLGGLACSQEEEPPTEERLIAEKMGRLIEAEDGKQGGAVTETELKTWAGMFRQWKEENSPEVYEKWKACMEAAEVFEQAEECSVIIDPQQAVEKKEKPKTIEEVCSIMTRLAEAERSNAHQMCRLDMERLQHATLGSWLSFGTCAAEASDTLAFAGCQIDALPTPQDHCNKIIAIRTDWEEILPPDVADQCTAQIQAKRASLPSLENRIDLSCCLNYAKSPSDIDECMNSMRPRCSPD